jgi:hypothetical protein
VFSAQRRRRRKDLLISSLTTTTTTTSSSSFENEALTRTRTNGTREVKKKLHNAQFK